MGCESSKTNPSADGSIEITSKKSKKRKDRSTRKRKMGTPSAEQSQSDASVGKVEESVGKADEVEAPFTNSKQLRGPNAGSSGSAGTEDGSHSGNANHRAQSNAEGSQQVAHCESDEHLAFSHSPNGPVNLPDPYHASSSSDPNMVSRTSVASSGVFSLNSSNATLTSTHVRANRRLSSQQIGFSQLSFFVPRNALETAKMERLCRGGYSEDKVYYPTAAERQTCLDKEMGDLSDTAPLSGGGLLWSHPAVRGGFPHPLLVFRSSNSSNVVQFLEFAGQAEQSLQHIELCLENQSRHAEAVGNAEYLAGLAFTGRFSERLLVSFTQLEVRLRDFGVFEAHNKTFISIIRMQDYDEMYQHFKSESPAEAAEQSRMLKGADGRTMSLHDLFEQLEEEQHSTLDQPAPVKQRKSAALIQHLRRQLLLRVNYVIRIIRRQLSTLSHHLRKQVQHDGGQKNPLTPGKK